MDLIIGKSKKMEYYTDIRMVFEAFGGKQREYNWLLTNIELNYYPEEFFTDEFLNEKRLFISGDELTEIVNEYDIQFIWCVLTGFKKDIQIDTNNLEVKPYADGNPGFWNSNTQVQHPIGTVELVCWDSSLTILITKDLELVTRFKKHFPKAQSINQYEKNFL